MTNLLSGLRIDLPSPFIGELTLPLASGIPAQPLQFPSPLLFRRFGFPFVSTAGLRLDPSLLLRFLLLLLVAVHLDVLGPFQSCLSRLPTFRGEHLRFLSSFLCLFPLKTEIFNHVSPEGGEQDKPLWLLAYLSHPVSVSSRTPTSPLSRNRAAVVSGGARRPSSSCCHRIFASDPQCSCHMEGKMTHPQPGK